jgi:hypothetical protein
LSGKTLLTAKNEKSRRGGIVRELKRAELAASIASCPLPVSDLRSLFEWIDQRLVEGCDDKLTHTRAFLAARALPIEPTVEWLEHHGGYCDCEVIANVETEIG